MFFKDKVLLENVYRFAKMIGSLILNLFNLKLYYTKFQKFLDLMTLQILTLAKCDLKLKVFFSQVS